MKTEIKKQWVKALRSGKYKKGTGNLKTKHGRFCCLGVLTDMYMKSKENSTDQKKWANDGDRYTFQHEGGTLPYRVQKWSGLRKDDPSVKTKNSEGIVVRSTLAAVNDGNSVDGIKKHSFKEIASIIEKQL